MLNKRLENRITVKDLAEELGLTDIIEYYHFDCGHAEPEEIEMCFAHHYTVDEFDSFEIDKEYSTLVLHRKTWGQCEKCDILGQANRLNINAEKIYCSDMPRPEGFENVTLYHGLAAYSGTFSPESAKENAINLINNPSWEVCCSTRAIGPIGLIISGTVITASNIDLCSMIDMNNGRRFFEITENDHRAYKGIIHYADQLKKEWDHDEIVVKDNNITAIWVKDWAEDFMEVANELSKEYNVPVIVIGTEEEYDDGK